jgi:hypothetical protein
LPSRLRPNILPLPPRAIFFALVPRPKTRSCATRPLPGPKSRDLPHSAAISRTLLRQLPPSSRLVSPGCRAYPAGSGKPSIPKPANQVTGYPLSVGTATVGWLPVRGNPCRSAETPARLVKKVCTGFEPFESPYRLSHDFGTAPGGWASFEPDGREQKTVSPC